MSGRKSVAAVHRVSQATMDDSIKQLRIVNAISSDPDSLLSVIARLSPSTCPSFGSPLHLVVSLGTWEMVQSVCGRYPEWICVPDAEGETPLHIASKLGRIECLDLFFSLPLLDDTIRAHHGKTAAELAKNESVSRVFASKPRSLTSDRSTPRFYSLYHD